VPAVGFVTCARWPTLSESDALAARALQARGVAVLPVPWNGPDPHPPGLDALVLRANWDYHFTPEAFAAWLDAAERGGRPVWNPPALVRWNLSKRYLVELAASGLPVVETVVLETPAALPAILAGRGWREAVVKPLISASGHDTVRVDADALGPVLAALKTGELRTPAIVQPFVAEITSAGEWSLVFVEGELTHAALKRPAPGDFRVQPRFGGASEARVPPPAVAAAARRVLAALPLPSLYARIDGVERAGRFTVMEVEVNEPGLFFQLAPAAAERFAAAICGRLGFSAAGADLSRG
jgi:glutathione synthase/RimK-type ligase-like ATP-grasp enzyme